MLWIYVSFAINFGSHYGFWQCIFNKEKVIFENTCSYFNYKSLTCSDTKYFKIENKFLERIHQFTAIYFTLRSPSHMLARSPLIHATRMVGMSVNGTRYSNAGWAEFITNREMKVAIKPKM